MPDLTSAVLWMRHGTSDDGLCRPDAHPRPDSPLTVGGAAEVERTAHLLADNRWRPTLVASSPLPRARQTATIVATALRIPLAEPSHLFAEWQPPHCVLGLTPDQYPQDYLAWRKHRGRHPDTALPGGESLQGFAERADDATTAAHDLAAEHGRVLIISHRLLIGAVAALHHGLRHPAEVFNHARDFPLAPANLWAQPKEPT